MAIPKIYKYGIEITKPWSSEMYDFNENIKAYYVDEITKYINSLIQIEDFHVVASVINPYGYGDGLGHDRSYMREDMIGNLQNAENYWIKEIVEEMIILQMIQPMMCEPTPEMPAISLYDLNVPMNIIGFESREEILKLREIYK
jgi:hypothetical protein